MRLIFFFYIYYSFNRYLIFELATLLQLKIGQRLIDFICDSMNWEHCNHVHNKDIQSYIYSKYFVGHKLNLFDLN